MTFTTLILICLAVFVGYVGLIGLFFRWLFKHDEAAIADMTEAERDMYWKRRYQMLQWVGSSYHAP